MSPSSGWTLLRVGFSGTAAAALAGYWLTMPAFTTDFLGMILVGGMAVLASAATLICLLASLRDEPTPEWVILALLFSGGVAMLLGMVVPEPAAFPAGLAVFCAGVASIRGQPKPAQSAKKRHADA